MPTGISLIVTVWPSRIVSVASPFFTVSFVSAAPSIHRIIAIHRHNIIFAAESDFTVNASSLKTALPAVVFEIVRSRRALFVLFKTMLPSSLSEISALRVRLAPVRRLQAVTVTVYFVLS